MPRYWDTFRDVADSRSFRLSSVQARDHYPLDVYECGGDRNPPCLILPPPGVPFLVLARLAQALAHSHWVVSWETRGGIGGPDHGSWSFAIEDFARDVADIAASRDIGKARVITWCESFNLLPALLEHRALEIEKVANISPAVYDERHTTAVSLANESFLASMTGGDQAAAMEQYETYRILRELTFASLDEAEKIVSRILALPMNDYESAARFAAVCRHFQERAEREKSLRAANTIESLYLHCRDDKVLDYQGTLAFFEQADRGKLILYRTGGHYHLFHNADAIGSDIDCFFQQARAR